MLTQQRTGHAARHRRLPTVGNVPRRIQRVALLSVHRAAYHRHREARSGLPSTIMIDEHRAPLARLRQDAPVRQDGNQHAARVGLIGRHGKDPLAYLTLISQITGPLMGCASTVVPKNQTRLARCTEKPAAPLTPRASHVHTILPITQALTYAITPATGTPSRRHWACNVTAGQLQDSRTAEDDAIGRRW